jgi:hypothetical protein
MTIYRPVSIRCIKLGKFPSSILFVASICEAFESLGNEGKSLPAEKIAIDQILFHPRASSNPAYIYSNLSTVNLQWLGNHSISHVPLNEMKSRSTLDDLTHLARF